jgi:protein involved in polysaccharide export with SLBB domain
MVSHDNYLLRISNGQGRGFVLLWVAVACLGFSGCAALTNPVANGIPVRLLPPELLAEPKEGMVPIPLACLTRQPPPKYVLQPGDVLSVFIEGVLGQRDQAPPVNIAQGSNLPPSLGFPIPIRDDGTLPLPLIKSPKVDGMTVEQAEAAITKAYTTGDDRALQPGRSRIIVTLLRPKLTRVTVIRQDTPAGGISTLVQRNLGVIRSTREFRGGIEEIYGSRNGAMSTVVDLPGYSNDVLTAMAYTGGLPGLDAEAEVVIERGWCAAPGMPPVPRVVPSPDGPHQPGPCGDIIRIPIRMRPHAPLPFQPQDVVLRDGDVVFIKAREAEVFYTGGLLPSGEFPLPRDYDLDVVEAISAVGGPMINGAVNSNNLTGQLIFSGIGFPSPRLVTVLRRVPGRGQVPIMVDLFLAMRDPRESLIIRPGDVIVLQESREQAVARYFTNVFNFNLISRVISTSTTQGTTALSVP